MTRRSVLAGGLERTRDSNRTGARGEQLACRWLRRRGWHLLHRNKSIGFDEVDIVAESPDGRVLACIEVKTCRRGASTSPLRRVDGPKRHRLLRSARKLAPRFPRHIVRIDVMTVELGGWRSSRIRHVPAAVTDDRHRRSGLA